MPDFEGMNEAEAFISVAENKLRVGKVTYEKSDKKAGTVIGQSVEEGTPSYYYTTVDFTVSGGPRYGETDETTTSPESTEPLESSSTDESSEPSESTSDSPTDDPEESTSDDSSNAEESSADESSEPDESTSEDNSREPSEDNSESDPEVEE